MADKLIFVQATMKASYMAVDAAMRFWLHAQFLINYPVPMRWRYEAQTAGTSTHTVIDSENRLVLSFILEAIGLQETLITVRAPEGQSSEEDLRHVLGLFHHGWTVQQAEHAKVEPIEEMPTPPHMPDLVRTSRRRGGAPTKDYNDWAHKQIAAGRLREEVYREWLSKRGLNPQDPDTRQQWRDAFRKAISRRDRTPKDGRT